MAFCGTLARGPREWFHDYGAAPFMMPLAMGILYLEYVVLRNLVIDDRHAAPVPVYGFGPAVKARGQPRRAMRSHTGGRA